MKLHDRTWPQHEIAKGHLHARLIFNTTKFPPIILSKIGFFQIQNILKEGPFKPKTAISSIIQYYKISCN